MLEGIAEIEEIVREFIAESRENIVFFETTMLEAERARSPSPAQLASMFRAIHSMKGSCGFLGFGRLESTLHAGETLLASMRDGAVPLDSFRVTALLHMVDVARRQLEAIDLTGSEAELDIGSVIRALEDATRIPAGGRGDPVVEESGDAANDDLSLLPGLGVRGGKIRVDVGLLDRLMNLVGELVLARNQVLLGTGSLHASSGSGAVQRLNLVTTELQETVMKTRMQPIGSVFCRFPRLVRELSVATGKRVRLVIEGRDTELDKTVLEAIQDPLTHLVRNAIDHGVEPVDSRRRCGKSEEGAVHLRAFHEGGMVNVEIADDGAGIDSDRVRARAVALGLASAEQVAKMSDRDALQLIFLPGFSTTDSVTRVSGRGVGMDVVRSNIDAIGGTVDVQTTVGVGTTIRIEIPLTLAIIPALIVSTGGARYAIPQGNVLEVLRVPLDDEARAVEHVQGARVLRLRGKLVPLGYLADELGVASENPEPEVVSIVVLRADDRSYGLVVDEIRDTEEIVVKPIWKPLKSLPYYAGATVMGDGRVALILDALGIARRIGVVTDARQRARADSEAPSPPEPCVAEEMVLLCRLGPTGRIAIRLAHVARLEEVPRERVERVRGENLLQYRGEVLVLQSVRDFLEERRSVARDVGEELTLATRETWSVVVLDGASPFGVVVDGVIDILSIPVVLTPGPPRAGVLGTMVVQGRITELIDIEGLMARFANDRRRRVASVRPHDEAEAHR